MSVLKPSGLIEDVLIIRITGVNSALDKWTCSTIQKHERTKATKEIFQSQAWECPWLAMAVGPQANSVCVLWVKNQTEGVKLPKQARTKDGCITGLAEHHQMLAMLPQICIHILPPGSCLVHTVPLAASQQLHTISYQSNDCSLSCIHIFLKVYWKSQHLIPWSYSEFISFTLEVLTWGKILPITWTSSKRLFLVTRK